MNKIKSITYLLFVLFVVFLAVGCSKSVEIEEVKEEPTNLGTECQQEENSNVDEEISENQLDLTINNEQSEINITNVNDISSNNDDDIKLDNEKNTNDSKESNQVASVIVKSENNLSDSEKQEIIDELSNEVEELLKEINDVE